MSEYELNLMRQRGLAARDSKARRGEFQFMLPPGFCWSEAGRIEIDPDEHVQEAVRMVFAKFRTRQRAVGVPVVPGGGDQDFRRSEERGRL
jgi:DNA invertase Pin-like site-specific DNA recombinase